MKRNGQVLLQVLVMAVIVAILATNLIQMMLVRSTLTTKASSNSQGEANAQSAFNQLMAAWAVAGKPCGNAGVYIFNQPNPPCTSNTVPGSPTVKVACPTAGPCPPYVVTVSQ